MPGESEHRLVDMVRKAPIEETCMIHGSDADIISLLLLCWRHYTYIFRDRVDGLTDESSIIDIPRLRAYLLSDYLPEMRYRSKDKREIVVGANERINSLVFIWYLVGMDFLPRCPSLEIFNGGMDFIAQTMMDTMFRFGSFITTSTSTSFYRFSVPIEYESENTPDSLSVIVLSSLGDGQIGSAIWVDDLSLIYNTSSIGELNGTSFEVFPNPVNDELSISSKIVDKMEVYSATGILIDHIILDSGLIYIYDTKKLANGLYLVKNSKGELKRFIVQH